MIGLGLVSCQARLRSSLPGASFNVSLLKPLDQTGGSGTGEPMYDDQTARDKTSCAVSDNEQRLKRSEVRDRCSVTDILTANPGRRDECEGFQRKAMARASVLSCRCGGRVCRGWAPS